MRQIKTDQILAVIKGSVKTYTIAYRLGIPEKRPSIYRRLRRLETVGKVTRFRYLNNLYWTIPA